MYWSDRLQCNSKSSQHGGTYPAFLYVNTSCCNHLYASLCSLYIPAKGKFKVYVVFKLHQDNKLMDQADWNERAYGNKQYQSRFAYAPYSTWKWSPHFVSRLIHSLVTSNQPFTPDKVALKIMYAYFTLYFTHLSIRRPQNQSIIREMELKYHKPNHQFYCKFPRRWEDARALVDIRNRQAIYLSHKVAFMFKNR